MHRENVIVSAIFHKNGIIEPKLIYWAGSEKQGWIEIDRIRDVKKAASLKAGGQGTRYTCRIAGKQKFLYLEEQDGKHVWFVEAK